MTLLKKIFIFFVSFTFLIGASGQEKSKAVSLKLLLNEIEKEYNVSFNYLEATINFVTLIPPDSSLSLDQKLLYIENETNLNFKNLDSKSITILQKTSITNSKVKGFIYATETNFPIENVNVSTENATTVSNSKGFFELIDENPALITISCIGYKTIKIKLSKNQSSSHLNVFLEAEIAELATINTHQILTSGISKVTDGTITIQPKKMGILPGVIEPDVLQTLQQIPGINSSDESVSSLNVRGGTHDQNLFIWNGIKMYQTGHFFGLLSAFNPNLANTISLSKNGTSAFYGESVSSVVDLSSNSSRSNTNVFGAGINMTNIDLYSKINVVKNGFIEVSARRSINDFLETPTYKEYFNKAFQNTNVTNFSDFNNTLISNSATFLFYDFTFKYFQKINKKNQLVFDFITIYDQLKVEQSGTISSAVQTEDNTIYQKNVGVNLLLKHKWNRNNKSNISVYSSSYELEANKNRIESNQLISQQNSVLDLGIKLENQHKISNNIQFNNGYQLNAVNTSNLDEINSPRYKKTVTNILKTHAFILELKYKDSLSRLILNSGCRFNYFEELKKTIVEPRLQFNYGITNSFSVEILGEFKSQSCFQGIDLQNDYFGIEKRRWILADNTNVPIQQSKQISLGFSYSKNNWLLAVDNFYKKVAGINSQEQGFQNQLEYVKTNGNYVVLGTELLLQKKINHFVSWISYTYNKNTYFFPDNIYTSFINNYQLNHVVSWAGIFEHDNFKIAVGSKWHSGKPSTLLENSTINSTSSSTGIINYSYPNTTNLNQFFQVNLSATYKWHNENNVQYKFGVSVLNLFNTQNETNQFYRINASNNSIEDVKSFALNRTFNTSFRLIF